MTAHTPKIELADTSLVDTRFTVPAIRCAGCISKIETGLAQVEGIDSARVNFSTKRVAIRHRPNLKEHQLVSALRQLGFEAQPVIDNPLGDDHTETRQLLRALAVAGFAMMNIMLLSVSIWSGAEGSTREMFHWISGLIALPTIAYSGRPFFSSALMALRYRRTNMDVPISIGVLLATALSIYETFTGGEHAYFESAVMLLFFLLAGRALDATMRERTRSGIGALLSQMGRSASVIQANGSTERITSDKLEPGMVMLVAAGEALAADGEVIEGTGSVDNSMLTGESRPDPVGPGAQVNAGAINLIDPIQVRVTAVAGDTVIAEIARLMDEAGQSRSRYVRVADRASRLYAPTVHSLAALSFIGWMIAGAGWHQSLVIAIAVLIITCPCALGLAVPAAQVVASGALLKRGLLVKDGSALERLAEVDVALFDKTGTLTLGTPRADISALDPRAKSIALGLAQNSRHPLSIGLAASLQDDGISPAEVTHIREKSGTGLLGKFNGLEVALDRPDVSTAGMASRLRIGDKNWTLEFSDPIRKDAKEVLGQLSDQGIQSQILSGDRAESVANVARQLGIFARPNATPQDKLAVLQGLKNDGRTPLMVGDGLNDGPALAAAHASIAPGTASDASQQAADAVFIGEKLMPVALAIKVARRTMQVVRQNFVMAVGYNAFAVPLAILGYVTPLIAAVAMSISSLIVVGNSLRLAKAVK